MKTLLLVLPVVLSLTQNDIEFGVNYFRYRDVKFVCLLTCEENMTWTNQFTKSLSRYSIGVSKVSLYNFNPNKIEACATHRAAVGILMETNCPVFEDVLYYASENFLFDSARKWVIMDTNNNITNFDNQTISAEIIENLSLLNFSVDTDLVLSKEIPNGYKVYEVYNYGKIQGGELIINDLGVWSNEKGLDEDLNAYKYYRRWNFQHISMRMVLVMSGSEKQFEPDWLTERRRIPGMATLTKTSGMVLNEVAEIHNFKYVYTVAERWIGGFYKNESHTVSATSIHYGLQDLAIVLRFNPDVYTKVGLVHPPLTSIETRYYYRIPTYGPGKFENQFLRPLSPGAWLSVAFITTLCGCLLLLTAYLERRPSSGQFAIFSILATICQQFFEDCNDSGTISSSVARKLTIFVTGISCVLIYNYYTSSVVSWLLNGPPPSINSLQELLDSPLKLIFEDVGYARSWLKTPHYSFNKRNAEVENQLRQKKVLNRNKIDVLTNLNRGIAMVKAGGYAFHTEVENANHLISKTFSQEELCELGSISSMVPTDLYVTVPKNSPYKEFFNWSLKRLMERGIVACMKRRTISAQVKCEGSSPRALALGGAAPAFILLAAGYVLAVAIMLLERIAEKQNLLLLRKLLQ